MPHNTLCLPQILHKVLFIIFQMPLVPRGLSLSPSRKTSRNQGSFSWVEGKEPLERDSWDDFIFPRAFVAKKWRGGGGGGINMSVIRGFQRARFMR